MRYDDLNFWCAICFPSIRFVHGVLGCLIVIFMFLIERRFQRCIACLILEKKFIASARDQPEKTTGITIPAVWCVTLGLAACAYEHTRPVFDSPCYAFLFFIWFFSGLKRCVSISAFDLARACSILLHAYFHLFPIVLFTWAMWHAWPGFESWWCTFPFPFQFHFIFHIISH